MRIVLIAMRGNTQMIRNTRIEHDKALEKAIMALLTDDTELYKQYSQNEAFKRWLENSVFELTNR